MFNLEIKKKSGSSIDPDVNHSKVPSSVYTFLLSEQENLNRTATSG